MHECSEIRYLSRPDLEALIAAVDVSEEPFGSTDRAIFLTAAMTGMRQGELVALRWRDVDWEAERTACAATTAAAIGQRRNRTAAKALKAAGVRKVHDLRHTFGTRMAASPDVAMRKVQEWMGHRDYRTTLIYADYEPGGNESALVDAAFASKPPADRAERAGPLASQRLSRLRRFLPARGASRDQRLRARHVQRPDQGPDPR
jgi:integrase